ncbi:Tyrosine recombinase XerD [termite gut metagenome]|uniref:Tyrosine recombinase XerD n=1 Tax=termite gut metagenome TaxID=433724 RepID=A0A5J4RSX3_9ZZZZ
MERKKLLSELEDGVVGEMKRLQYVAAYIALFKRTSKQFAQFVKGKGFENTFSEELGAEFLKEKYDYPPKIRLGRLPAKIHSGIRCIRLLGEYRMYGAFVRIRDINPDYDWSVKDNHVIKAYIKSIQSSDTSAATKKIRIHHIKLFYDFMGFRHIESVNDVTPEVISGYILSMQGGSPVYTMHRLRTLKFYLRFVFESSYCDKNLTTLIPRIKTPNHKNVPALWSKDEIVKLLSSIDKGSPSGKRDYAVLSLVVQLGIRASDIANLKLDNLKWERKQIEFQQYKTDKKAIYPILNEIGWAIIDYLRYGRPKSTSPYLFLSCNAPYTNLQSSAFGCILHRQMNRCGIRKKEGTVSGMHSLRHALARNLLEQNVPLQVLSEIMGHTSIVSSSPYLRVDIDGLRDCALSLGGIKL